MQTVAFSLIVLTFIQPLQSATLPCSVCTAGRNITREFNTTRQSAVSLNVSTNLILSHDLLPYHYDIRWRPDIYHESPRDFTVNGSVTAYFKCFVPTRLISVNIRQLMVDDVRVTNTKTGQLLHVADRSQQEQTYSILLSQNLSVGDDVSVTMAFTGTVSDSVEGIYWDQYTERNSGKTRYLVSTVFQPIYTRSAFPCVDEPALKTTFTVTIERHRNFTAVTNTRLNYTVDMQNEWVADVFEITPKPMSSYLVAFAVFDFCSVNASAMDIFKQFEIRFWAPCQDTVTGFMQYGSVQSIKSFYFSSLYLNQSYDFLKAELVVAPKIDFVGMENWGLISYEPKNILYDTNNCDSSCRLDLMRGIVHEIVHMWIGDMVTCSWWSDIWLHEGIATYLEFVIPNYIEPSWDMDQVFIANTLYSAFTNDDMGDATPVYNHRLDSNTDIDNIFKSIIYRKGASIVRMLHGLLLGNITFQTGLQNFIKQHAYGTANYTQFVDALIQGANDTGKVLKVDLKTLLETWILQSGFPLVTVNRMSDDCTVNLAQKLYLYEHDRTVNEVYPSPFKYRWEIPVSYVTSCFPNSQQIVYMQQENATIYLSYALGEDDWIIINYNQYGYYRVNYDVHNWQALASQLETNHRIITVINRAQLIDDSFTLSGSWDLDLIVAFNVTKYMSSESEYLPWNALLENIRPLRRLLLDSPLYSLLNEYLSILVTNNYWLYGWRSLENDNITTALVGQLTRELACDVALSDCIQSALNLYNDWKNNSRRLAPDTRFAVYCAAARDGTDDDWNFLLTQYQRPYIGQLLFDEEHDRRLRALSCTRNLTRIETLFKAMLSKDQMLNSSDINELMRLLVRNKLGKQVAFNHTLTQHPQTLLDDPNRNVVNELSYVLSTEEELQQLQKVINDTGNKEAFSYQLKKVKDNIRWRQTYEVRLTDWIQTFLSTHRTATTSITASSSPIHHNFIIFVIMFLKYLL